MKCLTESMRRRYERRRLREADGADDENVLGAMAEAVTPELLYCGTYT
ncbi:MAG: hypothetical protein HFI34_04110 [Lachnospiraceae bacterium]|nr:hypothetical protein [Lachnospiraceae bacterium]